MPPINNLLVIRSPDIHRAATFYKQIGMVFDLHSHGKGPEHYASEVNGFVFEIYPQRNGASTTPVRIGFSVDSVDETVDMLTSLDVKVVTKPTDSPWGRRAVVRDFDGHTVELTTPPNRDTSGKGSAE